jgi:hypothetical protein
VLLLRISRNRIVYPVPLQFKSIPQILLLLALNSLLSKSVYDVLLLLCVFVNRRGVERKAAEERKKDPRCVQGGRSSRESSKKIIRGKSERFRGLAAFGRFLVTELHFVLLRRFESGRAI